MGHMEATGTFAHQGSVTMYARYAVYRVSQLKTVQQADPVYQCSRVRANCVLMAKSHQRGLLACLNVFRQALALQGQQDRTAGRASRAPRASTRQRQAREIASSVDIMQQMPLAL